MKKRNFSSLRIFFHSKHIFELQPLRLIPPVTVVICQHYLSAATYKKEIPRQAHVSSQTHNHHKQDSTVMAATCFKSIEARSALLFEHLRQEMKFSWHVFHLCFLCKGKIIPQRVKDSRILGTKFNSALTYLAKPTQLKSIGMKTICLSYFPEFLSIYPPTSKPKSSLECVDIIF